MCLLWGSKPKDEDSEDYPSWVPKEREVAAIGKEREGGKAWVDRYIIKERFLN